MKNKESLREKFFEEHAVLESRIFSNKLYFKTISTPEDVFDFFWNKIEQIRKEDMERVVEILNGYFRNKYSINLEQDEILSIIKQSH